MAEWVAVCRLDELRKERAARWTLWGCGWRFSGRGAEVVALSGRCPHSGGSLGHGWIEEGEVVCPLHRWHFKLSDGRCTTIRGEGVHRFRCEVRGDEVWVEV